MKQYHVTLPFIIQADNDDDARKAIREYLVEHAPKSGLTMHVSETGVVPLGDMPGRWFDVPAASATPPKTSQDWLVTHHFPDGEFAACAIDPTVDVRIESPTVLMRRGETRQAAEDALLKAICGFAHTPGVRAWLGNVLDALRGKQQNDTTDTAPVEQLFQQLGLRVMLAGSDDDVEVCVTTCETRDDAERLAHALNVAVARATSVQS